MNIETKSFNISDGGSADILWAYAGKPGGARIPFTPPVFEIDGALTAAAVERLDAVARPVPLGKAGVEHRYAGTVQGRPDLTLELVFRVAEESPVVRFRYVLRSDAEIRLTKSGGGDALAYWRSPLAAWPHANELQLSVFNELVHSYCPWEQELTEGQFAGGDEVMGPILVAGDGARTVLFAYEHGSQYPNAFLAYRLSPERSVELRAVKGNYWDGRVVSRADPYTTLWFEVASVLGNEDAMATAYRDFVLNHLSRNPATRQPHIFYNTWAFQERNKWWNGKAYLDSMNHDRILQEIDIAHRMGIDVFVLDTGWYEKTGDWRVDLRRFPDGMKAVRQRLDRYGMKLGLWFSPSHAAVSSRILQEHKDCLTRWQGKESPAHEVWETEKSHTLCLVSRYGDAFAEESIRLVKELGVTYFKWDAIYQSGCDAAGHGHGTEANSERERAQSYAFQLSGALARIAARIGEACPEAIVDFDMTEGGRCFGLEFLTAGKYFLVNNGPYYPNYDVQYDWATASTWSNVFVRPGPARGWICRTPLSFDRWIPSVLFLTHYLPDDPAESQVINIASLILGQNGIWGDLTAMSDDGVRRFGRLLSLYKHVRYDITESDPVRSGMVGGSPELYEKISTSTGRGVVVAFASSGGTYRYTTTRRANTRHYVTPDGQVAYDAAGRARITWTFSGPGAKIAFFGTDGLERNL